MWAAAAFAPASASAADSGGAVFATCSCLRRSRCCNAWPQRTARFRRILPSLKQSAARPSASWGTSYGRLGQSFRQAGALLRQDWAKRSANNHKQPAELRSPLAPRKSIPKVSVKCNSLTLSEMLKEDSVIWLLFFYVLPHYQHFTFYAYVSS